MKKREELAWISSITLCLFLIMLISAANVQHPCPKGYTCEKIIQPEYVTNITKDDIRNIQLNAYQHGFCDALWAVNHTAKFGCMGGA